VTREEELARAWTRLRPRLVGVAYAVVGSRAEAEDEDLVSDCWLSLVTADQRDPVRDVDAWATVAAAGPVGDPADRVTLDERVSYALMVVLEALSPAERTAFVLHDLFGMPFPEVAAAVGRTPAAVRQLAVRARSHVASGASRIEVDPGERRRVADAFMAAVAGGDLATLVPVLDPDVMLVSDGGGRVSAARRPVLGADNVARFLLGVARKIRPGDTLLPVSVNGGPGFIVSHDGSTRLVGALTVSSGRISRIDLVLAPDKLPR